jgi:hypothetical protein
MQALETIKILTNIGKTPVGILQLFDAKYASGKASNIKKTLTALCVVIA